MARGALGLSVARTTAVAEILQLSVGLVAILGSFAALIWTLGFRGPDRLLFARKAAGAGR